MVLLQAEVGTITLRTVRDEMIALLVVMLLLSLFRVW